MMTYTVWRLPGLMPAEGADEADLLDLPPQEEKTAARAMKAIVKDSCAFFTQDSLCATFYDFR
jgi:hypothetical protein